jgi:UDP-glucose 4-epimerase
MKKKVILVTGLKGYWSFRVAAKLVSIPEFRVLGLDKKPPEESIPDLEFIRADIRNPLTQDLIEAESVDTVVHLEFIESVRNTEKIFNANVLGTMKLIRMCAKAGVRKFVLKSSTSVYGAHATNPLFLSEDQPLDGSKRYGYNNHLVEIDSFCNGFSRQEPDLKLALLRFPNIIGPTVDTGYNPLMQVIHEDDVVNALVHAVVHDWAGPVNVAAEGSIPLNKLLILAGKLPIPVFHPFVSSAVALRGTRHVPIDVDYLRYPWVADLDKMHTEFDFSPRITGEDALREFAHLRREERFLPDSLGKIYRESRLRKVLQRRRSSGESDDSDFFDEDEWTND